MLDRFYRTLFHQFMKSSHQSADFGCTFFQIRFVALDVFHQNNQNFLPIDIRRKDRVPVFRQYRLGNRESTAFQISHNRNRLHCGIGKSRTNNLKEKFSLPIHNIGVGASFSQKFQRRGLDSIFIRQYLL